MLSSYFYATHKPPKQVGLGKRRTFPCGSGRDPSSLTLLPLMYPNTGCHDNLPPASFTRSHTLQLKVAPLPLLPHYQRSCTSVRAMHSVSRVSAGEQWHQKCRSFLIISLLSIWLRFDKFFKFIITRFFFIFFPTHNLKLTAALASQTQIQPYDTYKNRGNQEQKVYFKLINNQGETEMHAWIYTAWSSFIC